MSLKHGLSESATRVALLLNFCPSGERAIAEHLGINPHELWPDRYHPDGTRSIGQKNSATACVNTIAPLTNVALFTELTERLVNRSPDLPGFGLFSGRAGLGKTFAATYAINTFRAFYVECDYTWTQRAFCEGVMVECGLLPANTPLNMPIHRSVAMIGAYLADNPRRPLIIDEADFLIKRRMIEIVRAIYKYCADAGSSIILIGEPAT